MEGLNKAIDTAVKEHEACSQERFETLYKKLMDNASCSETLREHNQTELVYCMRLLLLRQDLILCNQSAIMDSLSTLLQDSHWSSKFQDLAELRKQLEVTNKIVDDDVIREKELKKKIYG